MAGSPSINFPLVLSALGRGTADEALLTSFAEVGLRNWPDPDDDREDAQIEEYWRYGVTLEFEDTLSQERLLGVSGIQGPLTVSAVLFYAAGVGGHSGWQSSLPFQLRFDMNPGAVAEVLGPPRASRAPFDLRVDQFRSEEYVVDVCFAPGDASIDFVSVRLPSRYERGGVPHNGFDWTALKDTIGRPVSDGDVHAAIAACVGAPVVKADVSEHENTGFHVDAGVTVYTLPGRELAYDGHRASSPARCISGYKFSRAGAGRSRGYEGTLPRGLAFSDGPDVIAQKLPDGAFNESFEAGGRFTCEIDGVFLHVYYSLIYWQILSVSVFHLALAED